MMPRKRFITLLKIVFLMFTRPDIHFLLSLNLYFKKRICTPKKIENFITIFPLSFSYIILFQFSIV